SEALRIKTTNRNASQKPKVLPVLLGERCLLQHRNQQTLKGLASSGRAHTHT
ncbi:hypothetical protein BaRGS_00004116, partial [Batillaria attramentaria]